MDGWRCFGLAVSLAFATGAAVDGTGVVATAPVAAGVAAVVGAAVV
jgi:hypothetical protein